MNIKNILDSALCCGCGACLSECKVDAIKMIKNKAGFLTADLDTNKCVDCGICSSVCPSNKNEKFKLDDGMGNFLKAYISFSLKDDFRQSGQSGGTVNTLLAFLLDQKKVEEAYHVSFNKETNSFERIITKDSSCLKESSGSCYVQTQTFTNDIVNDGHKKAGVFLGCQSHALSLLEERKGTIFDYKIGLVCSGIYSYELMYKIIKKSKITPINIRFKDKRFGKWPGNTVLKDSKESVVLDPKYRLNGKYAYSSLRCKLCFDNYNFNCDLVCGDPWGFEKYQKTEGFNIVITKTEKGEELLHEAEKANYLQLIEIKREDLINRINIFNKVNELLDYHKFCLLHNQLEPYKDCFYVSSFKSSVVDRHIFLKSYELAMNRNNKKGIKKANLYYWKLNFVDWLKKR